MWNVWQIKKLRHKMNLLSFINYRDKAYDLSDVFLWWKKNKATFGKQLFWKNVVWWLYCMCKEIWYVVLTMHKLKLRLGYLKELHVRSEILIWKLPLVKKKSATMPFGSEAVLSQLFISSNTGSNISWRNAPRLQSTVKKYIFIYNVTIDSCGIILLQLMS